MTASPKDTTEWLAFDAFLLFPGARQLKRDGKPVAIGDKALDLLIALIERPGAVLSKVELAEQVWRREWVEDVTIRVTVGMLRKILGPASGGEEYIVNTLGRGYSFSTAVEVERWPRAPKPDQPRDLPQPGRLPSLLKPVIGRGRDIGQISDLLDRHRLVTIVGPGGIGKTTAAISSVSRLAETQGGVCFVDFGPIQDPALVPARIAAALGSDRSATDPLSYALNHLVDGQRLLVLDNCEHIADAAAEIAEDILRGAPRVKIVATSREPLRAEGEIVHRLEGLARPSETKGISAANALKFSAVELFVERTQAAHPQFVLTDVSAPDVAEICKRLDGIALAIQLAASRVAALGVVGVLSHLDDRFKLLANGPRTAMPRHRTLEAAFEWSYELLTPTEQRLFMRLSVFSGAFSIDAAVAIAGWEEIDEDDIVATLANLVDKSLVVFTGNELRPSYRMLETVRVFAFARLQAAEEASEVAERHAQHVIARCNDFQTLDLSTDDGSSSAAARDGLDDLRSALRWAFEVPGRPVAQSLVFAALPLLTHLGLTFEFKSWIERALDAENDPRKRLALSIGLGKAVHMLQSEPVTQSRLYRRSYDLAKELGDIPAALQSLWGQTTTAQALRRPREMIDAAKAFHDFAVVNDRPSDAMVAECLMAFGLHDIGAFAAAENHLRAVVDRYSRSDGARNAQRYMFNYRALALAWLASVEWRTGRIDQAAKTAVDAVDEAGQHVPSMFVALSHSACPIALERSDWSAAAHYVDEINRHCGHHVRWHRWADALSAILAVRTDRSRHALKRLDEILMDKGYQHPGQHFWYTIAQIQAHLSFDHREHADRLASALIRDLRDREEYWLLPEVVELMGIIGRGAAFIETDFLETADLAKSQNWLYSQLGLDVHLHFPGRNPSDEWEAKDSWRSRLYALPGGLDRRMGMQIQSGDQSSRKRRRLGDN